MASNRNDHTSSDSPQPQSKRFSGIDRQESVVSQEERAIKECSKILEHVTGNPKGYSVISSSGFSKKRIPRLYYINNNKTILIIFQGDITRTKVDAIVNAANEHMTGGSGVDGVIHHAAGDELYKACKAHKQISRGVRLPTGHSRILLSYNMSSTTYYIINTAGPMYSRYRAEQCAEELSSCYKTALSLANLYDLESIGFTAISCGIFGYPANDGADVALRTVNKSAETLPVVVFVLWDNHIYDAWIEKAEELKFPVYDPYSPTTVSLPKPSNNDNQGKMIINPTVTDDDKKSSTDITASTDDALKKDETEKMSENETADSMGRKPSISTEPSDTQKTEDLVEDDNSMDSNPPLTTHHTEEMRNIHLGKEESTSGDNPQPQETTEESKKSDDEKAAMDTTKDKMQPPVVEDNPEDSIDKQID